MKKEELIRKLGDIEWEDFEVKEASSEVPKNTWETVSSFSNTGGGWIIFGVSEKGKEFAITGVKNPEKIQQDFITTLRGEKFNVKIIPKSKKYRFKEGTVLAFYIPLAESKPVYFNTLTNTFIRSGSGDQRASKEEIDSMLRDRAFGIRSSGSTTASAKAVSPKSFKGFKEYLLRSNPTHPYNKISQEDLFRKLRVTSDGKLTYGGLFFFGKEDAIQKAVPDFRVDYLEIPGTSYSDAAVRYSFRLDEQENLWEYYFAISERLRRHLDIPFQLSSDGFATDENNPQLDALREALVNLLMHADYFGAGRPRIRVFDNRIEFFNPGALPKPLKQILEEDISMPRNPIIAKLFRVVRLAENAGYGFDKMISGWEKYTGTKPEFEQGQDFTKVTFNLKGTTLKTTPKTTLKTTLKAPDRMLALIKQNPKITSQEIADALGDLSKDGVKYHLDKLKGQGKIKRIGGAKGGSWELLPG